MRHCTYSMSAMLPAKPTNQMNEFGQNLQATLQSHMSLIDAELAKEDESKEEFYKKVG
jgi:hypothetical protein